MRRVVVTGLGLVTPLGVGVEHGWKSILVRQERARRITAFEVEDLPCRIAHVDPARRRQRGDLQSRAVAGAQGAAPIDEFILYGIAAADEAVADSGWQPATDEERSPTGVMIGSGIGGLDGIAENALILKSRPPPGQPLLHPRQPHQSGARATCRSATASRDRTTRW